MEAPAAGDGRSGRGAAGELLRLWQVAFPPACAACGCCLGPDAESLLCRACLDGVEPLEPALACPHCASATGTRSPSRPDRCGHCAGLPDTFRSAFAPYRYAGTVGGLVRAMKFRGAGYLAPFLAELAWPRLEPYLVERARPEVLVPVPMHLLRELRRGFNQAEDIAVRLGGLANLPVAALALERRRARGAQVRTRGVQQRLHNLDGVFGAGPDIGEVRGRRVLLVDDVMTTGATVAQAAAVLMAEGAAVVHVATVARA